MVNVTLISKKELSDLKDIAEKWIKKETPFTPSEKKLIRNYDENLIGKCKCGTTVYEFTKYCDECGQKLNWEV